MPKVSMIDMNAKRGIIDELDVEFDDNDFVIDLLIKAKYKGYTVTIDYSS